MPQKSSIATKDEATNTPILIRTYGEFWNPDVVNWEKPNQLWGKRRRDSKGPDIDVYEEKGIYVLYKDFEPVYVGKADKQSIGLRLRLHRQSRRKGPRWDRFSWFGIRGLKKNDKLYNLNAAFHPTTTELIATLEALLIVVINPRLNARKEKFRNAVLIYQSEKDKPPETDERLQSIEQKLDSLLSPGRSSKLRPAEKP